MQMPQTLQIGRVSQQTGLSIDTIRFYERQRLLDRPPRTQGGFRLFSATDVQRIRFIRRAQQLGFSLPEIRQLLLIEREDGEACSHVHEILQAKLGAVRQKIRELGILEKQLARSLRKCEDNVRAAPACSGDGCPVLREFSDRVSDED